MLDRRASAQTFRERLAKVIARSGQSQAAFARSIGLDRSTLAQLLSQADDRLPRAETLASIAAGSRVSVDWLLGLSQREQLGADVFGDTLQVEQPEPSPIDERMFRWMTEAAGYKIRSVPSSVPDVIKTEAVFRHEYAADPERTLEAARSRIAYLRRPETEMEVCCGLQTVEALALGEGRWAGVPLADRVEQMDRLAALARDLYPSLRIFLFDLRQTFSVPFTVFGPLRAAIYVGGFYLVFNANEYIRLLTRRFDELDHEIPAFAEALRRRIGG